VLFSKKFCQLWRHATRHIVKNLGIRCPNARARDFSRFLTLPEHYSGYDNPYLTVRAIPGRSPARVVLDSGLRTPLTAAVLNHDAPTYLMANSHVDDRGKQEALAARHVAVRHMPAGPGGLDIAAVLRQLYAEGIRSVVAEGGPRVMRSLLAAGLADRVIVSISSQIRGRGDGIVGELGNGVAGHALGLNGRSVHLAGDAIIVAASLGASAEARSLPASRSSSLT
jgi:riboflavin biosynthesis pyrimidine reductase